MNRVIINAIFPGEPVAWERVARGRGGHMYKPKKTRAAQTKLQWELKAIGWHLEPIPIARFGIQLVFTTRKRNTDWDNYAKLLTDAFNGKIWEDDSQIDEAQVRVIRSALTPSTHFICYLI